MLPDRRVLGDPQVPVAVLGELLERPAVGPLARLALDVGGGADLVGVGEHAEELVDGDQVVPDVEPAGAGVPGHPLPVGAQAGRDRALRAVGAHAVGAGKHHDAGHQPSDVPFERAGQRLIEVPQVERQVPFRGGPQPEVEQVGVAAELHGQPTVWTGPQIRRHDRGGSAVVGPRGGRHPAVADRQQLLGADRVLRQQDGHRITPAVDRVPPAQVTAWGALSGRAALSPARPQVAGPNRRQRRTPHHTIWQRRSPIHRYGGHGPKHSTGPHRLPRS